MAVLLKAGQWCGGGLAAEEAESGVEGLAGIAAVRKTAASRVLRAAALSADLGENALEQIAHIAGRSGMLRKEDVSAFGAGEQTDGVRRFGEFRGKRSQESGREALDDALDDAKAVAVGRGRLKSERGFRRGELLHDGSRGFVVGVALLEDACGGEGQFLSGAGELLGGLLQEREIAACHATSALATNEFDAPVLAHFVAAADEQAAYLAGAADVSAAAGLEVGSGDFNGAECAFALDFLADAESRQLGAGAVANGNGGVFEDDGVGGAFRAFEDVVRGLRATQIDAGRIGAEMKRDGRQTEAFKKDGGKEVLAAVLLHVIETAGPIEAGRNGTLAELGVNDMQNLIAIVANVKNAGLAELAEVIRLAAGRRIKGGLIEQDAPSGRDDSFR